MSHSFHPCVPCVSHFCARCPIYPILCYQVDKNSARSGFTRILDPWSLSPLPVKKGTPFVRGPHPVLLRSKLNQIEKLEDLKVLRRSPDLLNNVKIGQGQLQLIMEQILFLPYTFWSSDLNNLMNNPSNTPVISEKKMFR